MSAEGAKRAHGKGFVGKMSTLTFRFKGGPGSGHRGHRGIPGKRGGSLPGVGSGSSLSDVDSYEVITDRVYAKGSMESYAVRLPDGSMAIVKPESHRKSSRAEVLAHDISKELGWDELVPETKMVVHNGKSASVQRWVEDADEPAAAGAWRFVRGEGHVPGDVQLDEKSYSRMILLDTITANYDRYGMNMLVRSDGRVVAIDNGAGMFLSGGATDPRWNPTNPLGMWSQLYKRELTFSSRDVAAVRRLKESPALKSRVTSEFSGSKWDEMKLRMDWISENL